MKIRLLFLFLLCCSAFVVLDCAAQKEENVWVFGQYAGIDFSSGSAVAFKADSINAVKGTASVCDTSGTLLFYTDGGRIWNRNYEVMSGGVLNNKPIGTYYIAACQAACIVPVPNSNSLYYVFTLEGTHIDTGGLLYYTIVDMTLNNGLGDVVPGQKMVVVDSPVRHYEKMAAVAGENCDVWLMTMTYGANEYRAYHITGAGIDSLPVTSPANPAVPVGAYRLGIIKFSPDRNKLANAIGGISAGFFTFGSVELCDFDPATGIVSNPTDLNPPPAAAMLFGYGIAFSPDGSKLYVSDMSILQWDLSLPAIADIIASKYSVVANPLVANELKTAPDGKIYFTQDGHTSLHSIQNPNVAGAGCNPLMNAVTYVSGTNAKWGLPNVVAVPVSASTDLVRNPDTIVCRNTSGPLLELHVPPGYTSYEWDDSTTDTIRVVQQAGTYWVRSNDLCYPRVDTFVVQGGYIPPVQIFVDEQTLSTSGDYASWQWYRDGAPIPGAADSVYTVDTNGVYSVKVTSANGCTDSTSYAVTNVSVASWHKPVVGIYPNPAKDQVTIRADRPLRNASVQLVNIVGKVVSSQSGLTGSSFVYNTGDIPAGVYFVEVQEGAFRTRVKLLKE